MRTTAGVTYIHGDHLGSATNTTGVDVKTQRYYPWGARRSTTQVATPYRFTGQREESTIGLYFYNARWYDPVLARLTQADAIVPEPGNPQALNRYAYTLNNPVRYVDPTGYFSEEAIVEYLKSIYGDQVSEDTKELIWRIVLRSWKGNQALWNLLREAEAGDILMYVDRDNQIAFGRFLGEGLHKLAGMEGVPLPDLEQTSGLGDLGLPKVLQNDIVGLFSYDHAHLRLKYSDPGLGTWNTVSIQEVPSFRKWLFITMVTTVGALIPGGKGAESILVSWGKGLVSFALAERATRAFPGLKPGNDELYASSMRGRELQVTLDRGVVASTYLSYWEWPAIDGILP